MMCQTLVLYGMSRLAILIDQEKIDSFRVDAPICIRIPAAQDFSQRHLGHHLPFGIAPNNQCVKLLENSGFTLVE